MKHVTAEIERKIYYPLTDIDIVTHKDLHVITKIVGRGVHIKQGRHIHHTVSRHLREDFLCGLYKTE